MRTIIYVAIDYAQNYQGVCTVTTHLTLDEAKKAIDSRGQWDALREHPDWKEPKWIEVYDSEDNPQPVQWYPEGYEGWFEIYITVVGKQY